MKGDKQLGELFAEPTKAWSGPPLPGVPKGALWKLLKGAFGLSDAPRLWWTRLKTFLLKHGCRLSKTDPRLFIYEVNGMTEGMLATHVDDLLGAGSQKLTQLLDKIDKEFSLGSQEWDKFWHCGRWLEKNYETGRSPPPWSAISRTCPM